MIGKNDEWKYGRLDSKNWLQAADGKETIRERRPSDDEMTVEQIILDWLRHNGHTWGTGPGSLIAELAAHGYKIVKS